MIKTENGILSVVFFVWDLGTTCLRIATSHGLFRRQILNFKFRGCVYTASDPHQDASFKLAEHQSVHCCFFPPSFNNASWQILWWHIQQGRYCAVIIVPLVLVVLQRHGFRADCNLLLKVFFDYDILTFTLF